MNNNNLPMRDGVGIVVLNQDNKVFVGKRKDNPTDKWQMPQGGIDKGEDIETACFREMKEEIGTDKASIIAIHPEWLNYDIPEILANKLWDQKYRGQTQKWVALKFTGIDSDINIKTHIPEFSKWKWISPQQLTSLAAPFKREVYENVLNVFKPYF